MQYGVACLLLAVATAVCFHQLAMHPGDLLVGPQREGRNDVTSSFLAWRDYQAQAIGQFRQLPWWNPYGLSGAPWLGNPQAALFYPPHWLFLWLPAASLMSWLVVAHHGLAGLGTYLLCRSYGLRWSSSMIAGVIFLAAPFLVAQTGEGHATQVCLIAWVPWALLCYERLRQGQRGGIPLMAVVLAICFFCGHVQETFYLVLILSAFVLADLWQPSPGGPVLGRPRLLAHWCLVGLATAGLVAVELLPNWIYTQQAVRAGGLSVAQGSQISAGPANLWQLLHPAALGGPSDYRGPGRFYWETLCYFGIVPLSLALVGAVAGWRRYAVPRLSILAAVAFAFALGADTPIFGLMHRFLPGVSWFRAPSRALFFASLAVAVLAAVGWEQIARALQRIRPAWRSRLAVGLLSAATACGLLSAWLASSGPAAGSATPPSASLAALSLGTLLAPAAFWLGCGLAAAALLAFRPQWTTQAALLILVVCLADLTLHARHVLRTIPGHTLRPGTAVIDFLKAHAGSDRVLAEQELLSDREAWSRGIQKVRRYDPVPLVRFALYMAALTPDRNPALEITGLEPLRLEDYRKPLIDLLGVRYAVVKSGPEPKAGWEIVDQGWTVEELTLRGSPLARHPYCIYRNKDPLPRAFVLGHTRMLDPAKDMVGQLARLNPREQVLVHQDTLPAGPRQPFRPARIVQYTPNRVVVQAQLDQPGYLVLSDMQYGGWRAKVDGAAAKVQAANFAFRAVPLMPGEHTVVFQFQPPGMQLGLLVTASTWLLLLAWMLTGRERATEQRVFSRQPARPQIDKVDEVLTS